MTYRLPHTDLNAARRVAGLSQTDDELGFAPTLICRYKLRQGWKSVIYFPGMSDVPENSQRPLAHILCVSYDESLLLTRRLLLEGHGYKVTPAASFEDFIGKCREGAFDLLVLGHSIPEKDRHEIMSAFREHSIAPVLSLLRRGEGPIAGADYYAFPDDPQELVRFIAEILSKPPRKQSSGAGENTINCEASLTKIHNCKLQL